MDYSAPDEQCLPQIAHALGLRMRAQDPATLSNWIAGRLRELALPGIEQFAVLLTEDNAIACHERELLTVQFTTGKFYFFRDQEQFDLLAAKTVARGDGASRHEARAAPLIGIANE